jgi:class 3 adenylate cyclase
MDRKKLNSSDVEQINKSVLRGVVSRASTLSAIFCIVFTTYGFTSYEFLKIFDPQLTLMSNVWPRILFNTIPLAFFWYFFRDYKTNIKLKVMIWTIGLPIVFVSACMIHVWPLLYAGKSEIIMYVQSANVFVITLCFIAVSPPPKYLFLQVASFSILFVAPIAWMLHKNGNQVLLTSIVGDLIMIFMATCIVTMHIYKLRLKIATFDHHVKKSATPFLGGILTRAIYEQNEELLKDRNVNAIIIMVDIRGYSEFSNKNNEKIVRNFMTDYHSAVSKVCNDFGGFMHKTSGDGHLISFGVMNESADLNDIPGYKNELITAEKKLTRSRFLNAISAIATLSFQFDNLKEKFDITENISLGIGVAEGDVTVSVQGDESRKELDINGRTIILASRLEAYSKTIRNSVAPDKSVVVLEPTLSRHFEDNHRMFRKWDTIETLQQVRNFPEIDHVYYHVFLNKNEKRENIIKLRAS